MREGKTPWAEATGLVQLESGQCHPHIEKREKRIKAALEIESKPVR